MVAPEALEVADSVPHVLPPHPEPERAQETPLFWVSLINLEANCCVWLSRTVAVVGVRLIEITCGGGSAAAGGSFCGCEEVTPFEGTEAHPPRKTTDKTNTTVPLSVRAIARTPESEIKVEVLRCDSLKEPYF
jgi:hypothetical protein